MGRLLVRRTCIVLRASEGTLAALVVNQVCGGDRAPPVTPPVTSEASGTTNIGAPRFAVEGDARCGASTSMLFEKPRSSCSGTTGFGAGDGVLEGTPR
jgi:hypothetical protein